MCCLRMAVMHLPTKFCANSSIQFRVIDIFWNPRRQLPPFWIFKSCTFGTFRHVNSVVLELYIKFGSNICDSHWDQHTYALDVHLMTSRELTSGFDFCSDGHLRMVVVHLLIKFGVDIYIQSRVIDIFPKFKMAAAAILDCHFMWIWPFRRVDSVVFVFCTKFVSNICNSHWDRCTYASDIHLMTSRELTWPCWGSVKFVLISVVECNLNHMLPTYAHAPSDSWF